MSDPGLTTHTLDVPGARLYYERRGSGPLLLLIGSPMDTVGFAAVAGALAGNYTVVTYDPRGIGGSSREDESRDVTPEQQADDVHRLLAELGGGPALIFGSSGGAVVGLALVATHPGEVGTLIAHEPPVIDLLPDRAEVRAEIDDVYATYLADGPDKAMQKFLVHAGIGGPASSGDAPRPAPPPEQAARMRATMEMFLAHLIRPTTGFRPDIAALRATPTRLVVAGGTTSAGTLPNRTAMALAGQLGTGMAGFPGGHNGFLEQPAEFARVLHQVLAQTA